LFGVSNTKPQTNRSNEVNHISIKTDKIELKASGDSCEQELIDMLCRAFRAVSIPPVAEHCHRVGDKVSWQFPNNSKGYRNSGVVRQVFERSVTVRIGTTEGGTDHDIDVAICDVQRFVE
jgi:hypothetical protein